MPTREEKKLNEDSYLFDQVGKISIVVRTSENEAVNHLFDFENLGGEHKADAVIGFYKKQGVIMLSFADKSIGNAKEIMQQVFGLRVIGYSLLAATPLYRDYGTFDDDAIEWLDDILRAIEMTETKKGERRWMVK